MVLPKTVNVELSDSTTTEAEVTWDTSNYNGDVAGTYKLSGKISLPEGVINPSDLTATINVIVKESGETTSSLNEAYELIKSKLDTITYKNTTTEDSILSSLNAVTLPSDIAIKISESKLVKATYSKAGTLTLTIEIKSENGESKELTYVGSIAKLTSSSSSGHSGGSSSNNSNSADSNETEDKNNNTVNDNKTENNSATTTVVKTPSGVAVNVPTDKQAWVADNGQWLLFDKGNKATGWNNVNSTWYYLDNTGIMKTGWVKDNDNWYYLNGNGSMATGWVKENNTWYYLNGNGAMKTGWHLDSNGKWYYLNDNGSMAKDTYIDGYYVNANGEWE
ncbi:N-acetylmuramoyl-L-alanine amidase family protein [Clostridium butyricum]|uniref:N-acetylmuramoyl-L-alanine amidase family protein n=1 Tax=Clostridium butyricum TaxID=1492 RepID=UPI00374FB7BF